MTVTVKYFASIREHMGQAEVRFEEVGGLTVAELWQHCSAGEHSRATALPERVLAAVNQDYVDAAHQIADGDEVAFFPPVTGG